MRLCDVRCTGGSAEGAGGDAEAVVKQINKKTNNQGKRIADQIV
jgi:hypothetical protein